MVFGCVASGWVGRGGGGVVEGCVVWCLVVCVCGVWGVVGCGVVEGWVVWCLVVCECGVCGGVGEASERGTHHRRIRNC